MDTACPRPDGVDGSVCTPEPAADHAPRTGASETERADALRRIATGPGGRTAEVTDHVLLVRRIA
ncbi:hypothetical protein GCM10010398_54600 [Streptomyces fimbriatus]